MADDADTVVTPAVRSGSVTRGDVPERLRNRYLTEDRAGDLAFYTDATTDRPAFRDHGDRLTATRNDPNVIRDVVAIASHRGWSIVTVQGEARFRREAWLAGRAAGLEVRGYRPTERDVQEFTRRQRPRAAHPDQPDRRQEPSPARSMRIVDKVVRARVVEPSEQTRILTAARNRLAAWIERGASSEHRPADRGRGGPSR